MDFFFGNQQDKKNKIRWLWCKLRQCGAFFISVIHTSVHLHKFASTSLHAVKPRLPFIEHWSFIEIPHTTTTGRIYISTTGDDGGHWCKGGQFMLFISLTVLSTIEEKKRFS